MPIALAITAASSGIGRAAALRLARDGAAVAICARDRVE
jgi:NAD(P)-dependent dehydrogenase (short-subunit alcohol dehydrogenase family)